MTLDQFVNLVRNQHNAATDTNWSDAEIYSLITSRANEVLSIIGLIEATDTSTTTVAGTQAYAFPSNFITIKALLYNGELLTPISFKDWETDKAAGTTPTGKSNKFVVWNNQVLLVPTPDNAYTLTFYGEKEHPFIDNSTQITIDIPSVLHGRLANAVIADMAAKDLKWDMMRIYEDKWLNQDMPAFFRYAFLHKRRGKFRTVTDADTSVITDNGVV